MFQNLLMTGFTPLCNTDELRDWDNKPFIGKWPEEQRNSAKSPEVTKTIKKKTKRVRTAYSTDQLRTLEKIYSTTKYIDSNRRKDLAQTLKIKDKAIKIWFQNRRMKEKKDTSESSCDSSSEVVSCESPALSNNVEEVHAPENVSNLNYNYENYGPSQYQFPQYYYNGYDQWQNAATDNQNGSQYGVDSSAYPTQYYPYSNDQYNYVNNAQFYDQYNQSTESDWYAKAFNMSYL